MEEFICIIVCILQYPYNLSPQAVETRATHRPCGHLSRNLSSDPPGRELENIYLTLTLLPPSVLLEGLSGDQIQASLPVTGRVERSREYMEGQMADSSPNTSSVPVNNFYIVTSLDPHNSFTYKESAIHDLFY